MVIRTRKFYALQFDYFIFSTLNWKLLLVSCRHHGQSFQHFLGGLAKRRLNEKLYSFSSPGPSQQSSYRGRDYPISCQCSVHATSGPLTCKPGCSDPSVVMVSGEASVAWSCTVTEESCGANSKGIYGEKSCSLIKREKSYTRFIWAPSNNCSDCWIEILWFFLATE